MAHFDKRMVYIRYLCMLFSKLINIIEHLFPKAYALIITVSEVYYSLVCVIL